MNDVDLSVVVPTRDRPERLRATLAALASQTHPAERMEIIIVDDGSADGIDGIAPAVTLIRQPRAGAAAARNAGAATARGRLLVFVDDDVELLPGALEALLEAHARWPRAVIVGAVERPPPDTPFERLGVAASPAAAEGDVEIRFNECYSGMLGVGREDFVSLGAFRDPTGEWPSWDDIDFGYRASARGFQLVRCGRARAIHHDEWATSLERLARRSRAASRSAVRLFQVHPGIQHSFPIYRDKLPIRWGEDALSLTARKLIRSLVSSRPARTTLVRLAENSARHGWPSVARALCGCVVAGHQWQGLRDGFAEFGRLEEGGGAPVPSTSQSAADRYHGRS